MSRKIRAEVVHVEIRIVTPEDAERLLEKNSKNRALRAKTAARYANDMAAGKWVLSHQGIAVGPDGEIVDGQHRLRAVVISGEPQRFVFCTYGTEEAAQGARLTCDTGGKRTVAEVLTVGGVLSGGNARNIVAVVSALNALVNGAHAHTLSSQATCDAFERDRAAIEWAHGALADNQRFSSVVRAAFAFAWMACPEEVEDFAGIVERAEAPPGSAAQMWSKAAQSGLLRTGGGSNERRDVMLRVLRIIKAHVTGEGFIAKLFTTEDAYQWFAAKVARRRKVA